MNLPLLLILVTVIVIAVIFFTLGFYLHTNQKPRRATVAIGCSILLLATPMVFVLMRLPRLITPF